MVSWSYTGCVYLAMNKANGSIYIGKTIHGLRWRKKSHERDAELEKFDVVFHKAIRKHGSDNFIWTELYVSTDDASLCDAEVSLIADYKAAGFRMYNMTSGGEGMSGYVMSEETRAKRTGRKMTDEQKAKLSAAWTPERKAALAERMRNRVVSDETRLKSSAVRIGKKMKLETIEKVRAAKTGKKMPPWTEERRAKYAAAWAAKREAGYTRDPDAIARMAATKKRNYANDPEARSRLSEYGRKGAKARWGD